MSRKLRGLIVVLTNDDEIRAAVQKRRGVDGPIAIACVPALLERFMESFKVAGILVDSRCMTEEEVQAVISVRDATPTVHTIASLAEAEAAMTALMPLPRESPEES